MPAFFILADASNRLACIKFPRMKNCFLPALLLLILAGCKTKPLQYLGFENLKVEKIGFPNSKISMNVNCFNPNKFGLTLNSLESTVYVNEEFLGIARIDSSIEVPRSNNFFIPVKMDVKMSGTMTSLLQLMTSGKDSTVLNIKFEGKARLKKGGLLINYPISYQNMQVVKF